MKIKLRWLNRKIACFQIQVMMEAQVKSLKMSKNKYIPDRWDKYTNLGAVVEGTRFIAFKVPLNKNEEWNLRELKRQVPDLKVIIDLTNTNKYYQPRHCEEQITKRKRGRRAHATGKAARTESSSSSRPWYRHTMLSCSASCR